MQRHTAICRKDEATPHLFRTLELAGGEDGMQWAERTDGNSTFEGAVRALVERLAGVTGGSLQNITISSRANIEAHPPLVEQRYSALLDTMPGVSLTVLLPIRIAPERSSLEMWTVINRQFHGLSKMPILYSSGAIKYIARLLPDQLLVQFNAGETRPDFSKETFKEFANQTTNRSEIWVRPSWQAIDLLPEIFTPPAPRPPVLSPEQIEAKRDGDLWKKRKAQVRGQWESRGYRFDKQRQTWRAPKG